MLNENAKKWVEALRSGEYNMNDVDGKTFDEIADHIEAEPAGLFRDA